MPLRVCTRCCQLVKKSDVWLLEGVIATNMFAKSCYEAWQVYNSWKDNCISIPIEKGLLY